MKIKPVFLSKNRPILIAGPCSAETENQVIQTANQLESRNIDLFRSGIWKPRTRPNSFEGIGRKGLDWLKRVQKEFGMKVTTEVANANHVELALEAGIDVLWLGARTTVNPFSVQEIVNALKGVDIPVLVKNPLSPDLALWLGAIERLYSGGIRKIAAIHRGFSSFGSSPFRNKPNWEIALELKRQLPEIQLIVDPSHICGNTKNLQNIAQKAMDLNYDGIMLETHIDPAKAWSDAGQQIDPEQFSSLIGSLILRKEFTEDIRYLENVHGLRNEIDLIDKELIHLLGTRMDVSKKIALLKKQKNISIYQADRWNKVIHSALKEAKASGLSPNFINKLLRAIHEESINHQDDVMNRYTDESWGW